MPFTVKPAFVSYETPLAPCGGIAAVMGRLPAAFRAATRTDACVITPFHHRIEKTRTLPTEPIAAFRLPFDGRTVGITILKGMVSTTPYLLVSVDDPNVFAGERHPYDVGPGVLLRDALLFGAAVARGLPATAAGERWTLMLQDWETATVALSLAGQPGGNRCFLTLHNSYDHSASLDDLYRCDITPHACPGSTVLQRALSVSRSPVFTVSDQFALDLTTDTLQTHVLAPQLQAPLRSRIVGVDNGPFVDLACPSEIMKLAATDCKNLRAWKSDHRQSFLAAIDRLKPSNEQPVWGDLSKFSRDQGVWFVMAGRDDARQKGYDVAARAAELFLEAGGTARFLFFPMPGDEGRNGLQFLKQLAEKFPAAVLVFPFMFRDGFTDALRGAEFGLMPSLYEPFGMANEFYLNGTAGIGRATGGIIQQIVPWRAAACFSKSVQTRTQRWHSASAVPTGLLFRERDSLVSEATDWRAINAAAYQASTDGTNRVQERQRYAVWKWMAEELRIALRDAVQLVDRNPAEYFAMVSAGVTHIQNSFSWSRAAAEYARYVL